MEKTIFYIAGEGHSGSTLLDIILGAQKKAFSTGELTFLPQKGIINNEYCSCRKRIHKCIIWQKVIQEWNTIRKLSLECYIKTQSKLSSNKKLIQTLFLLRKPTKDIKTFIEDTTSLYEIIFTTTNSDMIIDSSKNPNRILILKHLGFKVVVIHLTRQFGGVLNSYKKRMAKNLKAGIEADIIPKKTSYVLSGWILKNFLAQQFGKTMNYHKIRYEDLINDPEQIISKLASNWPNENANILKTRGPFNPKHLVAGNRLRMKDQIYIAEKPFDASYTQLSRTDKLLSLSIDYFY
jgi:hypothetical protein